MDAATAQHLAGLAAARTKAFDNRNARSRSGRVHLVEPVTILGQSWPGLRCHTGLHGGELSGLEPTNEPVTCRLCLAAGTHTDDPADPHPTLW